MRNMKCPNCGSNLSVPVAPERQRTRRIRTLWLATLGVAVLAVTALMWVYRGHVLSGFHWTVEATGSNTAAVVSLALALVALVVLLLWMLLPLIVILGIWNLRRRTLTAVQSGTRSDCD